LPSVVLIAAASGLAWALIRRPSPERLIPFGPFLALGFWLVWRFGPLGLMN
jgi:prepilin signal peptidase PulO-like enzyme (type II secretory pathway)